MNVPPSMLSDPTLILTVVAITAAALGAVIAGAAFRARGNGDLRRLREALDVMPEGLAFYDAADRLIAWNVQYADICRAAGVKLQAGLTFANLVETSRLDSIQAAPPELGHDWISERKAARGTDQWSTQYVRGGRWMRITDRRTAGGGTVTICIDITEMKRNEKAIAEARDKAETLARRAENAETIAGLGHWRLDVKTQEMSWSPQMYAIYGLLDESQPLDWAAARAMEHPDDRAVARATIERQLADGKECDAILRIVRPSGEIRYVAVKSHAELGPDGQIEAIIGTVVDVTDQKVQEAELQRARAEAEAAVQVKAEFLANMSHELRTPLTSIVGFTSLAAEQSDLSALTRTYIERVSEASRALLCTVNDILDFSKLEAGQVTIQPRPVSLAKLCRGTLDLFAPQAGAKDLNLILDGEAGGDDLVLSLDPDRVRQVLLNLVNNAVKFTETGAITLRTRYDRSSARLEVEVVDTGAGIPREKLSVLFKRFSQIDGSLNRTHNGAGLGLAICKGLVEAMGGEVGVESKVGQGSRFWFTIPAAVARLPEADSNIRGVGLTDHAGLRVLVVDDHPANRQLAGLFLAGFGAEVTEAVDGEEAAKIAADIPFDVILMDIRMPKLDGPGALQRIRASQGPNIHTPILAFTADAGATAAGQFLSTGFQDVVAKPIDPAALAAALGRATAVAADGIVGSMTSTA